MKIIKNHLKYAMRRIRSFITADITSELAAIKSILIDNYLQKNLYNNISYINNIKLNKYEFQVYSQNGEDGIIQEIFARIGVTNKFFVEFGVENGIECNSIFLLLNGWKGCWLDGDENNIIAINNKFRFIIDEGKLSAKQAFITAENIEQLFIAMDVPKELDLLSIDIDGNDYWIWNAISDYSPRVVIIEFNALFRPPLEFVVPYEAYKMYPITSYFGASLKSLEILGSSKGYKLVGCNFLGVNAFFVREDLVGEKFLKPFTAETHYEPPRYYLKNKIGHKTDFGKFMAQTSK
jgi:hypothetical protein